MRNLRISSLMSCFEAVCFFMGIWTGRGEILCSVYILINFWEGCPEVWNRKLNEFTSSGSCLYKSFHHELLEWTGLFCCLTSWILFLSLNRHDACARITLLMPNNNDFTDLNFRNDRKSIWCSNNNGKNLVEEHKEI